MSGNIIPWAWVLVVEEWKYKKVGKIKRWYPVFIWCEVKDIFVTPTNLYDDVEELD